MTFPSDSAQDRIAALEQENAAQRREIAELRRDVDAIFAWLAKPHQQVLIWERQFNPLDVPLDANVTWRYPPSAGAGSGSGQPG